MSKENLHPCYICGADTKAADGVCYRCKIHKTRHTEMKDRKMIPIHQLPVSDEDDYSDEYMDAEEFDENNNVKYWW